MFPIHFEVKDRAYGESVRDFTAVHGRSCIPASYAFFCPHCGEIWARARVSGGDRWMAMTKECEKHTSQLWFDPAGSIWIGYDLAYVASLPHEVLVREFELHLTAVERALNADRI